MYSLKLSIANPCHENWGEMSPDEGGRFCHSCSKNVIDFTGMSDDDILRHFENNKDPVCGRFRNDQLNRHYVYISPEVLVMDIPAWKKFLAIIIICFGMFLTGCNVKNDPKDLDNKYAAELIQKSKEIKPVENSKPDSLLPKEIKIGKKRDLKIERRFVRKRHKMKFTSVKIDMPMTLGFVVPEKIPHYVYPGSTLPLSSFEEFVKQLHKKAQQ